MDLTRWADLQQSVYDEDGHRLTPEDSTVDAGKIYIDIYIFIKCKESRK